MNTNQVKGRIYKLGLKNKEVAEKLGYTPEHFSSVINGRRNISLKKLEELADILGCSVKSLL